MMGQLPRQIHRLKTGEDIALRSACIDDAQALLDHGRAIVDEGEFFVTSPDEYIFTLEQEQDWIRQYVDDPGKLLIVGEAAGQLVGVLFLESGSRRRLAHRASLHMSVKNAWRGHGVGRILLQAAIDWATASPHIEKLGLAVFATNSRAISLYRKLGFLEEGRKPREIRFGADQYVDDVLMYRLVKESATK
jgi:RimJ/RimL family protein N-acetyltransferase